jgi:Ca2+/Na+ antiporter
MENDPLKSIWKSVETTQKSSTELTSMFKEGNHPALKAIKKQALIELAGFAIFLFCYYTMFDGAAKPLLINIILVMAIAVNMFHHYRGYRLQQAFRANQNIKEDLKNFANKLKSYQLETLLSKVVWAGGLMLFFTNGIQMNEKKWWAVVAILTIFLVQLVLLNNIWAKRVTRIKTIIRELESA